MPDITFDRLSSTEFEEFCYDLLSVSGFVNLDWRKGTGLSTSPADKGRDIMCDRPCVEPDGSQHFERWFIECKHFKKAYHRRTSERPGMGGGRSIRCRIICSLHFLSNPAKDYLEAYKRNNRSAFKIRYWKSRSFCAC